MIEAFFNIEIMKAAWPIVLTGLWNTILLSLIVVPLPDHDTVAELSEL